MSCAVFRWMLAGCVLVSPLAAEKSMVDRLITLREKRDEALERAREKIDRVYRRELQRMLEEAVSGNDQENAERIRAEMATLGKEGGASSGEDGSSGGGLAEILVEHRWDWYVERPQGVMSRHDELGFAEDGAIERTGRLGFLSHWEVVDDRQVEVYIQNGAKWLFEFDDDYEIAKTVKEDGYVGDNKELRRVE